MKRLLLLPACLFCLASGMVAQEKEPPPPPKPPKPPTIILTRYDPPTHQLNEFYKQNPEVTRLYWKSENDLVVVHKDKTLFSYNMSDEKEKEAFEKKYGTTHINTPPPPPPPPPPTPPGKKSKT